MNTFLSIPGKIYDRLGSHVLKSDLEGAAFAYAKPKVTTDSLIFELLDWDPVNEDGFESRSEYHLSLSDNMRAHIIKRAHDLQASLVEFHSHSGNLPAKFSYSDFCGFKEFVPHVLWRLSGKPYIAIVFNQTGFDGLIWLEDPEAPEQLEGIIVDGTVLQSTKLTLQKGIDYEF